MQKLAAFLSLFLFTSSFASEPYFAMSTLSHTEGSGIGYKRGFTTISGFDMVESCTLYPFLEIRAHGFDNRKLAGNFGGGVRYRSDSEWILGANLYYDLRQGDHRDLNRVGHYFHQVGIGLEALSECVDFRFNFYQPVGKKRWDFRQIHFNDNAGITPIFSYKKQTTFTYLNAEMGGYIGTGTFCHCVDWRTYFAIGPYMIKEHHKNEKWGAALRLEADFTPYLSFEFRTGYDQLYLGYAQVKVSLNFPLYPLSSIRQASDLCGDIFNDSITQPARRIEIIPLKSSKRL
jgi:hypothetical protein